MTTHVALVACLDERRSVHSVTFKRAISLFRQYLRSHDKEDCRIECYDDGADAVTAAKVAIEIVEHGAYAVVGHFSSSAAAAAAPIYAKAGLPLLLPAATARQLTVHSSTYRVCDHDDSYARAVHKFCAQQDLQINQIEHDGSIHGVSVALALQREQDRNNKPGRGCVLFSGNCLQAINFLAAHGEMDCPVILTDDALTTEIVSPALAYRGDVYIVGLDPCPTGTTAQWFAVNHQKNYGTSPGCYFWETLAAIQIASVSFGQDINSKAWNTVLGPLQFDIEREAGSCRFAAYQVDERGLHGVGA